MKQKDICKSYNIFPEVSVKEVQNIAFDDAVYAYVVGCAIALKVVLKVQAEAAILIGKGLESFCIDGSVSEERHIGAGHGKLASMLLSEDTKVFAFLAGHESFAAAEGAIGIVASANKVKKLH